jgi:hypothetical protein
MYYSSRAPSERACLGLSLRAFNIALDLCLRITLELDADVIESDDLLRASGTITLYFTAICCDYTSRTWPLV